jgi:organic radical activating enzyme
MSTGFEHYDGFGPSLTNSATFENPLLFVNWNLGNHCTYKCSYCAKECHDGSFPWPTLEEAVKTVNTIDRTFKTLHKKKTLFFELLGGEVTLWKDFEKLIHAIHQTKNKVMLVTNGVRTLDWWKQHAKYFHHVTLSYHPEFADPKHLTDVSNILTKQGVSVCILLLMYSKKWDECVSAHSYFKKFSKAKTISLQKLTLLPSSKFAQSAAPEAKINQDWPYSTEQLEWMKMNSIHANKLPLRSIFTRKRAKELNNRFFKKNTQETSTVMSNSFLTTNNLNNWQGWSCYVGIDTLYLEQNGDIKRSVMCGVSEPLGSWRRVEHLKKIENLDSVVWPTTAVICPHKRCYCSHDFKARKETTLRQST